MKKINMDKRLIKGIILVYISGYIYSFVFLHFNRNFNYSLEKILLFSIIFGGAFAFALVAISMFFVEATIEEKIRGVFYKIWDELRGNFRKNEYDKRQIFFSGLEELEDYYDTFIAYIVLLIAIVVFLTFLFIKIGDWA